MNTKNGEPGEGDTEGPRNRETNETIRGYNLLQVPIFPSVLKGQYK